MILELQSKLNDEDRDVRKAALSVMEFAVNQGEIFPYFLGSMLTGIQMFFAWKYSIQA